jgi:hypothetical protein
MADRLEKLLTCKAIDTEAYTIMEHEKADTVQKRSANGVSLLGKQRNESSWCFQ